MAGYIFYERHDRENVWRQLSIEYIKDRKLRDTDGINRILWSCFSKDLGSKSFCPQVVHCFLFLFFSFCPGETKSINAPNYLLSHSSIFAVVVLFFFTKLLPCKASLVVAHRFPTYFFNLFFVLLTNENHYQPCSSIRCFSFCLKTIAYTSQTFIHWIVLLSVQTPRFTSE